MRKRTSPLAVALAAALMTFPAPLASSPLLAQANPAAAPAEAPIAGNAAVKPFPTRLRAAMKDGRVALTWLDSPDALGGYAIYRHIARIDASNLASAARLGVVAKGAQAYFDVPPDEANYFYLVLALAADGSPYETFVSASNATAGPISLKPAAVETRAAPPAVSPAAPAVVAPAAASPPNLAPIVPVAPPVAAAIAAVAPGGPIEALQAQARGDSIILAYKGASGRRLVVYRGTAPIERSSDLLDASLVATFLDNDGNFTDFPVPGIEYWYALLLEDDLKAGRIDLVKGRNATASGARVAMTKRNAAMAETSPVSRTPPLPAFLLDAATGIAVPASPVETPSLKVISPEAEKAVAGILVMAPPLKRPMPAIKLLPDELAAPSGGEDYALSLIVTQKLVPGDWAGAVDQLRKYLSLNRSEEAVSRARYYLGQALAFSGAYRDAFFEFLSARALHPSESDPWIEYVLAALRRG